MRGGNDGGDGLDFVGRDDHGNGSDSGGGDERSIACPGKVVTYVG
jgi:hypothetical protein